MIVKNESKIITRLFDSVIDIIDSYVICDTGSTDNTVDIITAYFANKGIRGTIIYEPFRDFGYNRTHSLLACAQNTCEYVLLLDADMILEKGPQFNKVEFYKLLDKGGAHYLFQGSQHSSYKNVRIIANHRGITYWGVTHEYVCTPPSTVYNTINRDFLYINDIGDGGAKADKSERDIRLLLNGLKTNPDNDRYTFYLANSYRDNGQKEEAIETYRKRVKIGGWVEEIWQSYYQIGLCYKSMGKYEHAIYAWWEAYECMPDRLENIYEIISHYRHIGKHKLVCNIYHMIEGKLDKYRGKPLDFLFTEPCVYDYKIDYEYSISAYYAGEQDSRNIQRILMNVLNADDAHIATMSLENYKFYIPCLQVYEDGLTQRLCDLARIASIQHSSLLAGFQTSTPTVCKYKDTYAAIVRFVNYRIDGTGNYINHEKIVTHNVLMFADREDTKVLTYDTTHDCNYVGLEDMRIYGDKESIYFTANRGIPDGKMEVQLGNINVDRAHINAQFVKMEGQKQIEKNWVFMDLYRMIYGWHPLTVITKQEIKKNTNVPRFFTYLRGSTHGQAMPDGETWFVCHAVSYIERRKYYHIIVVLDTETAEVKRWTRFFKLDNKDNCVEYMLGFVYLPEENTFLCGYSVNDACTLYKKVNKPDLDQLFFI